MAQTRTDQNPRTGPEPAPQEKVVQAAKATGERARRQDPVALALSAVLGATIGAAAGYRLRRPPRATEVLYELARQTTRAASHTAQGAEDLAAVRRAVRESRRASPLEVLVDALTRRR